MSRSANLSICSRLARSLVGVLLQRIACAPFTRVQPIARLDEHLSSDYRTDHRTPPSGLPRAYSHEPQHSCMWCAEML